MFEPHLASKSYKPLSPHNNLMTAAVGDLTLVTKTSSYKLN